MIWKAHTQNGAVTVRSMAKNATYIGTTPGGGYLACIELNGLEMSDSAYADLGGRLIDAILAVLEGNGNGAMAEIPTSTV